MTQSAVMRLGERLRLYRILCVASVYILIIYIGPSGGIKVIVHASIYPVKYVVPAQSLPSPHPQQPAPS